MLEYILTSDGNGYNLIRETDYETEKIVVPDFHNGLPVTEISASFENFTKLKEIFTGNNVKKTYYGAFNCPSLEKIYLGKSVETISGPFFECDNLTDVYFSGTEEEWENINKVAIDESYEKFLNAQMHFGILGHGSILEYKDETIFPYTHWDCVKGKPETIDSEKVAYDNSTSGLDSTTVKDAIDELNTRYFDKSSLESWKDLKYLVRSGRAAEFIKIGDRFSCNKNGKELVWDVIGIDADIPADENLKHSLTLQLSECCINLPFSVPEASKFIAAKLSPGQYYIPLKNYSSPTVYYGFTLTEEVEHGCLIRVSENKVYVYKSRSQLPYITIDVDFSSENEEEMSGRLLSSSNYKINCDMGSVDYFRSCVRKWINSTEINWWSAESDEELAPLDYLNIPGFASDIDKDFLEATEPVKKTTVLPDGTVRYTEDRFFLLSAEEAYVEEGKAYPYYSENSSLSSPDVFADAIRIKNFSSAPRHWWLRSSAPGDEGFMRILTDGGAGKVKASKVLSYGVAPACCIC